MARCFSAAVDILCGEEPLARSRPLYLVSVNSDKF